MEDDPWDWLSYRATIDMVMAVILIAVLLLYLWALVVGPVSALDPGLENAAPGGSVIPGPKPAPPALDGAAMV